MAKQTEFFEIPYKEGSLDAKAAELIKFAVNLAIGHEHGAKLHLGRARECGASEDEVWGDRCLCDASGRGAGAKLR